MKLLFALLLLPTISFAQTITPSGSSGGGGGTPGGTNGQIQFNNAGAFGGVTPAFAAGCSGVVAGSSLNITYSTQQLSVSHASGDTIIGGECGQLGTFNSGSAVAITLPQAGLGLFVNGWYEDYTNYGAGTVTFTTAAGTFLSAGTPNTYAITQGQGVRLTASTVSPGNWDISNTGVGSSAVATPYSGAIGGTGIANTGKTIIIGASLTTTGAGAPTLAFPAGSQTYTFPNATSTIVDLSSTQTLTGKSFDASSIATGQVALNRGGTNADLSATGGTSQFLKQASVGATIVPTRPVCADLSDSSTGCTANLASPPAIGGTTAAAGSFTVLKGTTSTATAVIGPSGADSTTAFQITKADLATRIVDVDTTNARVGINKTPGAFDLDVNGAANFGSTIAAAAGITGTSLTGTSSNISASISGALTAGSFRNISVGATATTIVNIGNSAAPGEVSMTLNGGNFTGTPNQFTINSTGNAFLSGNGTQAIGWQTGGAVSLPNIAASSAATTGTVCWTTGGNLTVDTTVACLASLEELKDIKGPIIGALDTINKLDPFWYTWKKDAPEYDRDQKEQPGLGAHQVESVDSRLAGYGANGELRGVRYQQLTAVLVAAIQEQQREIETLKTQMQERHAGIQ